MFWRRCRARKSVVVRAGITAESERNSPCVNAKLTPASQRGILHCVDTQAITLAWISH
jgi:hypothetical protein